MNIINHPDEWKFEQPVVVTIGNFDGVHLGHQKLVKDTVQYAKNHKALSVVITFDPHPENFFSKKNISIFSREDFQKQVDPLGVDYVLQVLFTKELSRLKPEKFLNTYVLPMNPISIFVGTDFRFGLEAQGTAKSLKERGESRGIKVSIISDVCLEGSKKKISSSLIRLELLKNNFMEAKRMLGRDYYNDLKLKSPINENDSTAISSEMLSNVQRFFCQKGSLIFFRTSILEGFLPGKGLYEGYLFIKGVKHTALFYKNKNSGWIVTPQKQANLGKGQDITFYFLKGLAENDSA